MINLEAFRVSGNPTFLCISKCPKIQIDLLVNDAGFGTFSNGSAASIPSR